MHSPLLYLSIVGASLFCGELHEEERPGFATAGGKTVATVTVNPDSLTLQVGDIGRATCTPQNKFGAVLTNTCTWTSRDTTVAKPTSGSQSSSITARKVGNTWVVATAGGKRDSARVSVVDTVTAPPPPPPDTTPPPPPVTLLFNDPFTSFAGWSDLEGCDPSQCPWVRTIVTSPVRTGTTAYRAEVRRADPVGSCYSCSKRTEIGRPKLTGWSRDANGPFKWGDETWFGFSIFIPADWINDAPYSPGGGEILFQLHEQPDGNDWAHNRTSFLRLIAEAGNFRWISYGSACKLGQTCWVAVPKMDGITDGHMDYIGPMDKGAWTDWAIHAKWSYNADGVLEVYKNGAKVATYNGLNNYNTDQPGWFKLGIYKWDWGNTGIPARVAVYDNVKICSGNCGLPAVSP